MASLLNVYVSLSQLKAACGIASTDTSFDQALIGVLQDTSRLIDKTVRRHFYNVIGTRYYDARDAYYLELPDADILSLTALATDYDGDGVYETSWLATDYVLGPPENANTGEPFWQIRRSPYSSYYFPTYRYGGTGLVSLTGRFGYYYQLTDSLATASAITTTTQNTFTASATVALEAGQTLTLDAEQMTLLSVNTSTKLCTVTRAINGTTAATHLAAAPIYIHEFPIVSRICLAMAHWTYKAEEAPNLVMSEDGRPGYYPRNPAIPDMLRRLTRSMATA